MVRIAAAILGLVCVAMHAPAAAQSARQAAAEYRSDHEAEILRDFMTLLAIPNYAHDAANIRRNAEHIRDMYSARGFEMRLFDDGSSPPVVYGRRDVPGATRTIALYVHYDGQQAHPENWISPPYEPVVLDGPPGEGRPVPAEALAGPLDPEWRIQARSAGDDKAPVIAIATALDALAEAGIEPSSNIVLLFDGEEEIGSPHLAALLEPQRDLFADVDLWLFCDGPVHISGRPQLIFGARGVVSTEITVFGAATDLHSGHYGNWAPVPGTLLANLLASMKAADGTILIERFNDTTLPITDADRAALAALPETDAELRRRFAIPSIEAGDETLIERAMRPSLTIRGLSSGEVGEGVRNAIPATATANLEIRLAPGNEPEQMLDLVERHIAAQGYHIVREPPDPAVRSQYPLIAMVERGDGYPGIRSALDSPRARELVAALRGVRDDLVILPAVGGTLPLYLFGDIADAPTIVLPIANADNNQHGPNENLRLGNLWYGIEAMAAVLTME